MERGETMKDYYEVLGVSPSDDQEKIKQAYRQIAKENHPDVNPDNPEAEEIFKEASRAWEILGDVNSRKSYDAERAKRTRSATGRSSRARTDEEDLDLEEMFRDFAENFGKTPAVKKEATTTKGKQTFDKGEADDLFRKFMGFK